MWYHKETRRPVAFEDIERMEAIPNWQELFEYPTLTANGNTTTRNKS